MTPRAPRPSFFRRVLWRVTLGWMMAGAIVACGVFQDAPTQRGDWGWMLSEDGFWIHEEGAPHYEAYEATIRHWNARGDLPPCDNRWPRVEVIERDGPVYHGQANGYVASSTAKRAIIVVNAALEPDVVERLVVHEMVHVCGFWANIGPDRAHSDPKRWEPAQGSVEVLATCDLQPELGYCPEED